MRVPGVWGSQTSRQSAHGGGKVVSPTHRPPLPPGNIPSCPLCKRLSQPQGHNAAGRIMSIKNVNDTIVNRTRDLPAFSASTNCVTACPVCHSYRRQSKHSSSVFNTTAVFGFITINCMSYWVLRSVFVWVFLRHSYEFMTRVQTKRKCETHSGMYRIPTFSEVNDFSYLPNPSTKVIFRTEQGI